MTRHAHRPSEESWWSVLRNRRWTLLDVPFSTAEAVVVLVGVALALYLIRLAIVFLWAVAS